MEKVERLKRQLVRDLVQQNVDLIQGHRPQRPRRSRPLGRLQLFALSVLLFLSVTLAGSSRLLPSLGVLGGPASASRDSKAAPAGPGSTLSSHAAIAVASTPVLHLTGREPVVDSTIFPLAVHRIVIDAGHGGGSVGTRTPAGLLEKEVTLDVAERLRHLLTENGAFEVLMTRDEDKAVALSERVAFANRVDADVFVSIHVNWIENRGARGVETYYLGPTNDPFLTRLAAVENRDSGYSMSDLRQLLDRIYAGVRQDKSRKLAETVQSALFKSLGRVNPKIENRGVKAAPFIVLLSTQMPAILAEVSCLSNEEEANLLAKPFYRQYIAEALAAGLRSYAESVTGAAEKGI